jgi:hypothetical protein
MREWGAERRQVLGHWQAADSLPMFLVPLAGLWPPVVRGASTGTGATERRYSDAHAFQLQERLHQQGVEAPVKCLEGQLFVRVSVHVYNTEEDYARLAAAVKRLPAPVAL